jgi:hypothetical protein
MSVDYAQVKFAVDSNDLTKIQLAATQPEIVKDEQETVFLFLKNKIAALVDEDTLGFLFGGKDFAIDQIVGGYHLSVFDRGESGGYSWYPTLSSEVFYQIQEIVEQEMSMEAFIELAYEY